MRAMRIIFILCVIAAAIAAAPAMAGKRDLGRETLAPNDGWASSGAGTTGGSLAAPEQVYVVTNRAELIAALNNGVPSSTSPSNPSNEPKIIYVSGIIDANVDDNNQPLTCQDYYRSGYTLEAFLAAYDPTVWGRVPPTGLLETARLASRDAQQARVRIRPGSNTTIVGLGDTAEIRGAWFDLRGSASNNRTNIIIRNITFRDVYDCFPAWSPTDGSLGAWNALYDAISLRDTNHVWVDHNLFEDLETADSGEPVYFGVHYERHDGLVDITNASDMVTVSWNVFHNHDKVMLIGSSDSASADTGKLNVTIHHNLFDGLGQRTPRVRYGKVHVYNNLYKIVDNPRYVYSWGVGKLSAIYAENNYFQTDQTITADRLISNLNGTAIYAAGTRLNGMPGGAFTDVVEAYNAANDPDLETVGWTPVLFTAIDETQRVVPAVHSGAGPFDW